MDSIKVCIVGDKIARKALIKAVIGDVHPYNEDDNVTVYKHNVRTNKGSRLIFLWDVKNMDDHLVYMGVDVVVYIYGPDINNQMRLFTEKSDKYHPLIVNPKTSYTGEETKEFINAILSIKDKDMVITEKPLPTVSDRLRSIIMNLTAMADELDSQ